MGKELRKLTEENEDMLKKLDEETKTTGELTFALNTHIEARSLLIQMVFSSLENFMKNLKVKDSVTGEKVEIK